MSLFTGTLVVYCLKSNVSFSSFLYLQLLLHLISQLCFSDTEAILNEKTIDKLQVCNILLNHKDIK